MIYVVIPVKDRVEYTLKCLESFYNQSIKDIQVIVVDDGSADGTKEKVLNKFPKTIILEGDGNLWCMGAFAKGIEYIKNELNPSKNDYVFTQNQDTYFDNDYLEKVLEVAKQDSSYIVGTVNYSAKTDKPLYHVHMLKGGVFKPTIINGKISDIVKSDTLNTRGTLFPYNVFNKVNNFSKLFPHYAGDYEITCRAKKYGFNLVVATNAICYSWDSNKNLAARIKDKPKKNLRDIIDLFTSRRSPNNLYYSNLLVILSVPFPQKILGLIRINAYAIKYIMYDYLFKSVLLGWKN